MIHRYLLCQGHATTAEVGAVSAAASSKPETSEAAGATELNQTEVQITAPWVGKGFTEVHAAVP